MPAIVIDKIRYNSQKQVLKKVRNTLKKNLHKTLDAKDKAFFESLLEQHYPIYKRAMLDKSLPCEFRVVRGKLSPKLQAVLKITVFTDRYFTLRDALKKAETEIQAHACFDQMQNEAAVHDGFRFIDIDTSLLFKKKDPLLARLDEALSTSVEDQRKKFYNYLSCKGKKNVRCSITNVQLTEYKHVYVTYKEKKQTIETLREEWLEEKGIDFDQIPVRALIGGGTKNPQLWVMDDGDFEKDWQRFHDENARFKIISKVQWQRENGKLK